MVDLTLFHRRWQNKKILVAGDLLLDHYTLGHVGRVSPEAPVAVLVAEIEQQKLGGAGNVLLNLLSLGAQPLMLGRIGDDLTGQQLLSLLQKSSIQQNFVIKQPGFVTPKKMRFIAAGQQLLRVDSEKIAPVDSVTEEKIIALIPDLCKEVAAVVLSDYGKGLLSLRLLSTLINEARAHGLPIIADPKGKDFSRYNGVTLLTPNSAEAYSAAAIDPLEEIEVAAEAILKRVSVDALMVTRSEKGISLFYPSGAISHHPVDQVQQVRDVTGAGDTVVATCALALANGFGFEEAAQLANAAATISVAHLGCYAVPLHELQTKLRSKRGSDKVVYEHELSQILKQEGSSLKLITISLEEGVTSSLLAQLQESVSASQGGSLLLQIKEKTAPKDLVQLLAGCRDVRYIAVKSFS